MVNPNKEKVVQEIAKLASEYPVIGMVDLINLPARQLQNIREQLRGKMVLRTAKKRLIKIAFKQAKKETLLNSMPSMPAVLFTKENPFSLYKFLDKNKSSAPAKAGQIAPKDILVKAGPTPFAPGPIIGELGSFGIKSAIEGGKVVIKEDKIVLEEGKEISGKMADILKRLDIQPMEIGLNLKAVMEGDLVFDKKVLHVDEEEYISKVIEAYSSSLALSIEIGYPTKENIEILIGNCARDSRALAVSESILTSDTVGDVLAKAEIQAQSLKDITK